jgi:CBS domain-containing membrane protein
MQRLRSLGPAVAHVAPREALRAGLGAFVGLGLTGLLVLSPVVDLETGLYLVAPFGASSVLLFAVPNSPLAQPWSAVVGNTVAALVGVAVSLLVADPVLRVALAVGLAIAATMLCRALHPPAGAVAMTAALGPEAVERLGFAFALAPVGIGTLALVLAAMAYARLTGRHYPLRQFDAGSGQGTADRPAVERLNLTEGELTAILERYRHSFNLGVEDLARLIGAAEMQAASHVAGPGTAGEVMSRDLVTIGPDTPLAKVAAIFARHRFAALPVVNGAGDYLGTVCQVHLLRHQGEGMRRLLPRRAGAVMETDTPRVTSGTPLAALLPLMALPQVEAVPVLAQDGRLVGIVTRTDVIAALGRAAARGGRDADPAKEKAAPEGTAP